VATAGRDRRLRIWEFDSLRQRAEAPLEEARADAELQFSPDGALLVVASPQDIVFLDAATLVPRHEVRAWPRSIHLVPALRPDGRAVAFGRSAPNAFELVVAGLDGTETVRAFHWSGWPDNVPRHLAFSSRGDKLVCVTGDRVHVFDGRTLETLQSFPGRSVFQAAFPDEGEGLVTVSIRNEVRLLAPDAASPIGILKGDPEAVTVLDRSFLRMRNGVLVAQGADRSLLVASWLRDRKVFIPRAAGADGTVFSPSVSADGARLAFSTREAPEKVRLHRLSIGRP
jgi:WD40 repeat protein